MLGCCQDLFLGNFKVGPGLLDKILKTHEKYYAKIDLMSGKADNFAPLKVSNTLESI